MKKIIMLSCLVALGACSVPVSKENRVDLVAVEKCKDAGGIYINKLDYIVPFTYYQFECFDDTKTYFKVTSESIREKIGSGGFKAHTMRID